jgi:acetyl esterase/lipase
VRAFPKPNVVVSNPNFKASLRFNIAIILDPLFDDVGGVRDFALSEVAVTHEKLVRLGVQTDLHVYEGMGHIFTNYPDLPESREAYAVIVHFFDRHLSQ